MPELNLGPPMIRCVRCAHRRCTAARYPLCTPQCYVQMRMHIVLTGTGYLVFKPKEVEECLEGETIYAPQLEAISRHGTYTH